jgi:hypothetical protein
VRVYHNRKIAPAMKKEVRNEDGRNAVFGTAQKTPGAKWP